MTDKPIFFAAEICAAWPEEFPPGRILEEKNRHMTLVFLGSVDPAHLLPHLLPHLLQTEFPKPKFHIGLGGKTTGWVFLPHVIAAKVEWISEHANLADYKKELETALKKEKRPFFPHITIARNPFSTDEWENFPCDIPFYVSSIVLQESQGFSIYETLWSYPLIPPFEEIEHTADIAFLIRGLKVHDLELHAQLALAFKFPTLLPYIQKKNKPSSLDHVIANLNQMISKADQEIGTPLKAISYHAQIVQNENYLEWKMIVDV